MSATPPRLLPAVDTAQAERMRPENIAVVTFTRKVGRCRGCSDVGVPAVAAFQPSCTCKGASRCLVPCNWNPMTGYASMCISLCWCARIVLGCVHAAAPSPAAGALVLVPWSGALFLHVSLMHVHRVHAPPSGCQRALSAPGREAGCGGGGEGVLGDLPLPGSEDAEARAALPRIVS